MSRFGKLGYWMMVFVACAVCLFEARRARQASSLRLTIKVDNSVADQTESGGAPLSHFLQSSS